jgi:hypothetical protein
MEKSFTLFIATVAPFIAGACIATGSSPRSTTSGSDYCRSLVSARSRT